MRLWAAILAAALIFLPTAAAADPISAAIGAAVKFFAGSKIATAVAQLVLSAGLSKLAQRLARRRMRVPGQQVEVQTSGETVSESFIVGRWATDGHLAYAASHGRVGRTPNAYFQKVLELSGVPVTGLHAVILGEHTIEFGASGEYGAEAENEALRHRGNPHFWVKFYDGTQTEADPMMVARNNTGPRPWEATAVGTGLSYAIATWRFSREVWQSGIQSPRFVIDGIALYDPRFDSSRGGDGPQRHDNPATWGFTSNPVVIAYNAALGIPLPDGNVYGGGYGLDDLPLDQWAAAMTEADARGWEFGAQVNVADDEPADLIEACMAACAGQVAPFGGELHIQVGEPRQAVWAITDGDISADDPTRFDPIKGLQARHNAVVASWISPEKLWQPVPLPMLRNAEWEAEDGGRLLPVSLQLAGVADQEQAGELASIYITDERLQRQHQLALPPDAARLRVMDVIEWTSPANGYQDKLFEVAAMELRTDDLFCVVTLREVDPDDYDPPSLNLPSVPSPAPLPIVVQEVPGFAVAPAALQDGTGTPRRPAILLSWDQDQAEDVQTLRYEIRISGGAAETEGVAAVAEGRFVAADVVPATAYQARAQLIAGRRTEWTPWLPVTTPDIRIGEDDVTSALRDRIDEAFTRHDDALDGAEGTVAELRARIEQAFGSVDLEALPSIPLIEAVQLSAQALRRTRDEINALATHLIEVGLVDHVEREELRRAIMVEVGENRASFTEAIQTVVSDGAALASRTTTLEAETAETQSLINQVEIAFAAETEALAALITAISVGTANSFDPLTLWRFDATVEGWTGAPNAPSITTAGFIRPGSGASSLISPAGLDWNTATHRQVRALLRREGAPTWVGYLWYAGEGEGWDASRRVEIDEPDWIGGEAEISVNLPTGLALDRFRLDLVSDADGTDYIEADWIGIGSPSPGASSAELQQEVVARIAGDSALAALINALDARLNDAETGLDGQVSITSGLIGQVEAIEDGIEALGSRTDEIEAQIEDPETGFAAIGTAIEELAALVQNTETGGLLVLSQSLRRLRAETEAVAGGLIEQALQGWLANQESRQLVAEVSQNVGARIEATDDLLRLTAQAVTQLQVAIPGLATVQALDALITQIEVVDGEVTALASRVTEIFAGLGDNEAEINSYLLARVNSDGAVAAVNTAISAEYGSVQALAEATAFAEATADGLQSGFVWSLGGDDVLSLVRVSDGASPVTTARIRADYIRLDGDTEVLGSFRVEGENVQLDANTVVTGYLGSTTYNASTGWRIHANGQANLRNVVVDAGNMRSGNFSAGNAGWRVRSNGDAEFNALTLREGIIGAGPIARGLTRRTFIQQAAPFDGSDPANRLPSGVLEGSFDIGSISFSLPSDPTEVPALVIIRPFVGGKLPFASLGLGAFGFAYEFRMRLIRGGVEVINSGWAFSPFWQYDTARVAVLGGQSTILVMARVYYGCVPERIRFYLENDGAGSLQAGDDIEISFRQYMSRSDDVAMSRVSSETIELDIEEFLR